MLAGECSEVGLWHRRDTLRDGQVHVRLDEAGTLLGVGFAIHAELQVADQHLRVRVAKAGQMKVVVLLREALKQSDGVPVALSSPWANYGALERLFVLYSGPH